MHKKQKLPPLRKNETRALEFVTSKCLELLDKMEKGEPIEIEPKFLHLLIRHHLHLYSRLIDANYVMRIDSPLVDLDIIH